MKYIKKLCYVCLFVFMLTFFANIVFPAKNNIKSSFAETLNNSVFQYISISKDGQKLSSENFKTIDNETYIISNGSISVNLNPLAYNYDFSDGINQSFYFLDTKTTTITATENETTQEYEYPQSFEFKNVTYYYRVDQSNNVLRIYKENPSEKPTVTPIVNSKDSTVISFSDNEETHERTFYFTLSITLKPSASDNSLSFALRSSSVRHYTLNFMRPIVKFANAENPIVEFNCSGLDAGTFDQDNTITPELSYTNVKINFLNNNYTEGNPLYFDINYNGFVYNFELYSKLIDGTELLFVNYKDSENADNNEYLATAMISDGTNLVVDSFNKILKMNGENFNIFSLVFDKTGRYEISFYDSTYVYGLSEPNYYSSSFYIKDETMSAFDNIYIIAQTYDEDNNPIEYIVSTSTLNYSVKATIKNLTNLGYSGGNAINLEDILEKVEVKKTTFGGSSNIPTKTNYSATEILAKLNSNNDYELFFDEDAYYQITIYQKNSTNTIYYDFTIIKHAKTTFSIPLTDSNGQPILDSNGNQKIDTYEAKVPYKTEIINYSKNILSAMNIKTYFSINSVAVREKHLDKTFTNKYTISYGMQQVLIEQYEPEKDDDDKDKTVTLNIRIKGVGELRVYVTLDGKTTEYALNSEKGLDTLEFTDYGTYTIRVVDSMGTESTKLFTLKKSLNFSAIALIILSSIVVGAVVLFILISRTKVKTR